MVSLKNKLNLQALKFTLTFVFVFLFSLGCQFQSQDYSLLQLSSVSGISPANAEFMYLDLNLDYYDEQGLEPPVYEINTTEEYGDSEARNSVSNCEIPYDENTNSSEDIVCIMDMMEETFTFPADLDGNDGGELSVAFNVPEGMCEKLHVSMAWHWNKKIRSLLSCK